MFVLLSPPIFQFHPFVVEPLKKKPVADFSVASVGKNQKNGRSKMTTDTVKNVKMTTESVVKFVFFLNAHH